MRKVRIPRSVFKLTKLKVAVICLTLLFINLSIALFVSHSQFISSIFSFQGSSATKESHALEIVNSCSKSNKEQCYAKIFYDVTTKEGIDYSLDLLNEVQRLDPAARGCHFIAHNVSISETMKDLNKWKEVLAKIPVGDCSGGFVHGVIEAKSTSDPSFDINVKTMPLICETIRETTDGKSMDANCSHIMGHLALVATVGDVEKAVDMCSQLPEEMHYECYSGVYMENETRDNLVDHGIAERIPWNPQTTEEQVALCKKATGVAAQACWREVSHMFAFISQSNPTRVYAYCSEAPTEEMVIDCYRHGVGIMTVNSDFNPSYMKELCSPYTGDPKLYRLCYINAVGSMIMSSSHFADRAVTLCNTLKGSFATECYATLGERLMPKTTREERVDLCKDVPDYFKTYCINGG